MSTQESAQPNGTPAVRSTVLLETLIERMLP
jgi:hypothetical protein